jgi:drug/metabolite transporter (DMT)-like permease
VIAYFLLGERLTMVQIAGSLIILAGVAFLRIYEDQLAKSTGTSMHYESVGPFQ